MKKKIIALTSIIFLGVNIFAVSASDEKNKTATFMVKPFHSQYQKDVDLSYFNYDMKPGEIKQVSVLIENVTDESIVVVSEVKNALSTPYGTIEYINEEKTNYSNFLKGDYQMMNMIKGPEKINLVAGEQKRVVYEFKIEGDTTKGEVLGAIGFMEESERNLINEEPEKTGISLMSRMEYVIAIYAQLPGEITGEIKFGDAKINLESKVPQVQVNLENHFPQLLKELKLNYRVVKKDEPEKTVFEGEKKIERFTPVTQMNYLIPFEGQTFEAGDYLIEMKLSGSGLKESYEGISEFSIDKEQQQRYVDNVDGPSKMPIPVPVTFWEYAGWIFSVLGILLFILFFKKRKRKKKELKN